MGKVNWEYVNSINTKSVYLDPEDPSGPDYNVYLSNRILTNFIDSVMYANDMNTNWHLDPKLQYDYLYHAVRQRKRFFLNKKKAEKIDCFEIVQEYFGYSNRKTIEAIKVLTEEQIDQIREFMFQGGVKK
jgi:Bacteriophage clamp loader A subunit